MKIIDDDIWLCGDCLIPAVNDDFTSLDFSYETANFSSADEQAETIVSGLEGLGPHLVPNYDSETDEGIDEFSCKMCDCCGTDLAGDRYQFAILG